MITIILILTILNTIVLSYFVLQKFNETFTIVKTEVYQTLLDYWGEYHDEEGNELNHELAGGTGTPYYGFFKDEVDEEEPEEEENE